MFSQPYGNYVSVRDGNPHDFVLQPLHTVDEQHTSRNSNKTKSATTSTVTSLSLRTASTVERFEPRSQGQKAGLTLILRSAGSAVRCLPPRTSLACTLPSCCPRKRQPAGQWNSTGCPVVLAPSSPNRSSVGRTIEEHGRIHETPWRWHMEMGQDWSEKQASASFTQALHSDAKLAVTAP